MLVLTRIDDRLIHGQVVEGWVNHLKATCIMVADDRVAANVLQRSIMEISVPRGLKVLIGSVETVCAALRSGAHDADRVILLFSNPADVLRALSFGVRPPSLNIGGMRFAPGKRRILDVLAVSDDDIAAFREIAVQHVNVDIQTVPTGRPLPLLQVLRACDPAQRR